jgi:hypothetical protein
MTKRISEITENLDSLHNRLFELEAEVSSVEDEYCNYLDNMYPTAEVCGVTISKPSKILKQFQYNTWGSGLTDWIDQQIRDSQIEDTIKDLEKILEDEYFEIDIFSICPISKKDYEDQDIEIEKQVHDFRYKITKLYTGEYVSLHTGSYIYIELDDFLYVSVFCSDSKLRFCDITEEIIFDLAQKISEKLD